MATVKFSRQRECIKKNLMQRADHPTADMVYEDVRAEYPNISLGTVYRNLALLAERGEILKLSAREGPDRFDGNVEPHDHFMCRVCGRVLDLPHLDASDDLFAEAKAAFAGRIEGQEIHFYGVCPLCCATPAS